ncbi:type II toxin-antitoxin system PemK/MazF family toxin [Trinickia dinghuensis]|nr:type II toxin-antitoxin system PemK/MazF family toxin [Trinickia dinghuensis]
MIPLLTVDAPREKNLKSIKTNPSRGDVYDCILGNYDPVDPGQPDGPFKKNNYDYRIPNEMRKRRPVVILGERNKQFLVVPISKLQDRHKKPHRTGEAMRLHVRLSGGEVPATGAYRGDIPIWAKTDLVQSVDEERLREFRLPDGSYAHGKVSPEKLRAIQEGVMRHIGLTPWVEEKNALQCQSEVERAIGVEAEPLVEK